MRHITCVENIDNLRALVKQDLRELGIKVPKVKKSKKQGSSKTQNGACDQDKSVTGVFGNYLAHASCIHVADCGYVPRFLVDASDVILENVEQEGLFRKSGAVSRQKELKQQVEEGKGLLDANVFDVTSLIKQYFRELPEPLFTSVYHDAFIKCFQLVDNEKAVQAVFLLTLLLPGEHLSTLRYVMKLLSKIASHSEKNKMDPTNLAVVLAPNIMHINSKSEKMNASEEKLLQWQTGIVELLIHSADSVGMVSDSLYERTSLMTEAFGTDDDLDASEETLEESRGCKKKEKRRKRSGSFQGLVSSIAQSINKWRRSTDGKAGNMSQTSNISQVSNTSHLSARQNESTVEHGHPPLPPGQIGLPTCTPVMMRKRKASGEINPFSASKKKAILQNLPNQATLANTPFTPASGMRKLDINAMKRAGTLNTPSIAFSNSKTPVAFSATPCNAEKNNSRKRINLFSPASARKGKKVVSSTNISVQSYGKKGKSKGLFRRLSGGKGEKLQESTNATKAHQVGQRLASPERTITSPTDQSTTTTPDKNVKQNQTSSSDESPIAAILQNSVLSPSCTTSEQSMFATEPSVLVTEQSVLSVCDDRNSLNEGFIVLEDDCDVSNINPDNSHIQNSDIVRNCVSDLAINVSVNDSHVDLSYRHSFCAESDASRRANLSLRRGKPNSIKAGLLQGEQKRVNKIRRSFGLDKSEISDPIPVIVPLLPQCLDATSVGDEQKAEVKDNSVKLRSDISISKINGNLLEVGISEDKKISSASITTVDNTKSLTKSDVEQKMSKQILSGTDESESGFSDKSSDTVKVDPISNVANTTVCQSSSDAKSSKPADIVQNQTNEDTDNKYPKMQTVDSTDSLLIGQLETSPSSKSMSRSISPSSKSMSRSVSTDSGKGSMFDESGVMDNCETGKQQSINNVKTEEKEMETESPVSEENGGESKMKKCNSVHSVKDSLTANVSRSHSMYCNSSLIKKQPNLQISAETHKLLSRAGYLSNNSAQPASDDDFVVMGPGILKIKQAETIKPRRESIIQLQTAHKGRVKHSIKQFNQGISNQDTEVTERHMSPYRFANSVSRKVGNALLKVPDILNNTPCEVNEMQEVININNRLGKGQAKVPISTHLLKPTDQVTDAETTESDTCEKAAGVSRKNSVKRRPSIYYASSEAKNRVLNKTQVKMLDVTLANVQEESVIIDDEKSDIEQEPMDVTETTDRDVQQIQETNKENGQDINREVNTEKMGEEKDVQHQVEFDKVELNESLIETINSVCTPRLDKIAKYADEKFVKSPLRETNTSFQESMETPPKLPPRVPIIKQPILTTPLTDRVCLRTAGGMTPRQVIKNCNSPRSPMKPVKRLKSPGSPHRSSRLHSSPSHKKSTQLSSIPQHLQQEMEGI